MVKVSYLIGLYNKEDYIVDCIDSILKENTKALKIEICIVDDGSTDNSYKLVKERFNNLPEVKIHKFEINKGKNAAYNYAYLMSTGDYICIFGADDIVIEGRTTKLLQRSISNSNKAVYGGLISKNYNLSEILNKIIPKKQNLYSITMSNALSGGCSLIPRSLCGYVFPIPEDLKFEDWWISYALVKNNEVMILEDYVTIYRISGNNDCAFLVKNTDDLYLGIKRDYERHIDYLYKLKSNDPFNCHIDKAIDLRLSFLGKKINKFFYTKNFDVYSLKIILFKIIGARLFYNILFFIRKKIN